MVEVLPAILEKTFEGVQEKCVRLRGIAPRAQLDIMDGAFVPEESWRDASQISQLPEGLSFDVHLMVEKPELKISEWNHVNVFRITFHQSATYDVLRTIKLIKDVGKEAGVALNLETPVSAVYDILGEIDLVLLMGVLPGAQERAFNPKVIEKVRELREHSPSAVIGVDGGVSPLVAPKLVEAGANVLVSGSYLFGEDDIASAIASLQE
ncbi:MAG: ribulose-phosphate 3-epimerase [Parcubacteria group bacterium]|nr:ribulose-phosphate 3-epimerase [Parcubacteria group bacterium]MBI2636738.1 ribulose-phosphate 3-epimerase [Parcubacteria group bacterium]